MALVQQWKCQDNAASTTVVATVGTNGVLEGGDNTSTISVVDGPGTAFPRSLDLNGTDDVIDVSGSSLSFASGTAFSFAWWFKFDALGANRALMGVTGANTSRCIWNQGTNNFDVSGSSGTSSFAFSALTTGVWYHVLLTRTAGNSVRCFLDAVESVTGAISIAQTFAPTRIGRANTLRHNGRICDVRVYDSDESANVATIMAEKDAAGGSKLLLRLQEEGLFVGGGRAF